jgi:hypothetical protein
MIIYMDDYRRAEDIDADALHEPHLAEERLYGNGSAQAQLAPFAAYRTRREPTPDLPDDFSDVDLREFIERVSALATQI